MFRGHEVAMCWIGGLNVDFVYGEGIGEAR